MPVYSAWQFPHVHVPAPTERRLQLIASPSTTGCESASVIITSVVPGGTTGRHSHECDEIIFVTGRGTALLGEETELIETDSVIIAPRGVPHECRNGSETATLKLYCVFVPPLQPWGPIVPLVEKTKEYLQAERRSE